jgi:hypothetical protein
MVFSRYPWHFFSITHVLEPTKSWSVAITVITDNYP